MNFYSVRSIESRYFSQAQNSRQPLEKVFQTFSRFVIASVVYRYAILANQRSILYINERDAQAF